MKIIKKIVSLVPSNRKFFRRLKKFLEFTDGSTDEGLVAKHFWSNPKIILNLFENKQMISEKPMSFIYDKLTKLGTEDRLEKSLFLEREYFLKDHNLQYTDKMSMAAGVEVRVPFLDTQLVTFTVGSQFNKDEKINFKICFKNIMEKKFSRKLAYRSKTGFGVPLRNWVKNDLSSYINEFLSEERVKARGIFDPQAIKNLIKTNTLGREDYSYVYLHFCVLRFGFKFLLMKKLTGRSGINSVKKKISVIFGTRPEAIKLAPVIKELERTSFGDLCYIDWTT